MLRRPHGVLSADISKAHSTKLGRVRFARSERRAKFAARGPLGFSIPGATGRARFDPRM